MTSVNMMRVRLLTYNIHGCIGRGRRYDALAIIEVLRETDADFVALQEVYGENLEDRRFLRALEDCPYPEIEYGVTLQHPHRGDYGNILLSKWPLKRVEKLDLSIDPHEPRGAIRAQATLPAGKLDLTVAHLGLKGRERLQQLFRLMGHWNIPSMRTNTSNVFCFMGDLNEWLSQGRALNILKTAIARTPALPTFPANLPVFALDRIYIRPERIVSNRFVHNTPLARRASDHLPLVADILLGSKKVFRDSVF